MKLSFHMGTPGTNQQNTILISHITDISQLHELQQIIQKTSLLHKIDEYKGYVGMSDEATTIYNLTIFLPEQDEASQPYGSFEYLFSHDDYKHWKQQVLTKFPDLAEQFIQPEITARAQQELDRRYKELETIAGRNRLPGKENTQWIENRIAELREQLYPTSPRRGSSSKL